jgi:hypothetical protein
VRNRGAWPVSRAHTTGHARGPAAAGAVPTMASALRGLFTERPSSCASSFGISRERVVAPAAELLSPIVSCAGAGAEKIRYTWCVII